LIGAGHDIDSAGTCSGRPFALLHVLVTNCTVHTTPCTGHVVYRPA